MKSTKVKLASVTAMVMVGQQDIHAKVKKYPGVYAPFEFLSDNILVKIFEQALKRGSFVHNGIEHSYVKKAINSPLFPSFKQLNQIRKFRPDIVLLQGLYFPHIVFLLRVFLNKNTKIVVQDHANRLPSGIKRTLIKLTDSRVNKYVFTSVELAKPWLDSGVISDSSKIIECTEGSTYLKRNLTIRKDPNSFLWVGRLDKNKDPFTILIAFKEFLKVNSNATLTLFYSEEIMLDKVKKFVELNQMKESIQLKGKVDQSELEEWYQRSSYFLLGSQFEGGSFSLMEAMACGCIPIVSDIPANRMMLNKGKVGYLFPVKDSKYLTSILGALNPEEIEKKSQEVIEHFKEELSFEAIARKLTAHF